MFASTRNVHEFHKIGECYPLNLKLSITRFYTRHARIHIENKRIAGANQELTERERALDARETHIDEREQILENEAEASINQLKDTIIEAASKLRQAPGKRVNEYPPVAMKKGYRAVPEKDLEIHQR